jgi:thiol-disulfide isomerase/thioredoxin
MSRPLLWAAIAGATLFALAGYRLGMIGDRTEKMAAPVMPPGLSVFELTLTDLNGKTQNLAQWRGKVLIVNYWATWCQPCREEMPGFSRLQDKYRDKSVQFVGISSDTADKIIEFQKTTPVTYPLLIGDLGIMESSAKLGNIRQGLPFTAVFDREGNLSATKLGRLSELELEGQLKELISR